MSLEIQRMIRDQANETRDELSKMVSWEAEIQKRDDQLIALAREGKFGYVPPETTRVSGPKGTTTTTASKPKKVTIEPTDAPKKPAAAPRDYRQWEAIDARLKAEEQEGDDVDPKESAEQHKAKGNEYYKKKNWSAAIQEYSAAQRLDPSNPVYFFNRATAYFQISNFVESEKDATRALNLDPRYTKAFVRRGLARNAQGKLELALQDFEAADRLEPATELVVNSLKEIRGKLGISADGKVRPMSEPKVAVVEEAPTEPPKKRPKVEVIEEVPSEPPQKRPKVEVIEEGPPEPPKKGPKVEVIDERPLQPAGKVSMVSDEPTKPPGKVSIVSEEPSRPPGKVSIVSEEPSKPPGKVTIASEEPPRAVGKVSIVSEEPAKPAKKVTIVAEEPLAPTGKVTRVPQEAPPEKVIVPAAAGEAAGSPPPAKEAPAPPQKKRPPRPVDPRVDDDLDSPRRKPAKKPTKKSRPKDYGMSWVDLHKEEYPARLRSLDPSEINASLGTDWNGRVVLEILKILVAETDSGRAFAFVANIGRNEDLPLYLSSPERPLAIPLVIEIVERASVGVGDKLAVRKSWGID
jgi:hypothetical protein